MARSHAQLLLTIWADREWRQLSHTAQWFYELLISQEAINYAGVLPLTVKRWAGLAADVDEGMIRQALRELCLHRFTVVDEDTEEVLVRSFIRNNELVKKPNLLKAAMRVATQVVSPILRAALRGELQRLDVSRLRVPAGHETVQMVFSATLGALGVGSDDPPPGTRSVSPSEGHAEGFVEGFVEGKGEGPGTGTGTSRTSSSTSADGCVSRAHTRARARDTTPAELNATATPVAVADVIAQWRAGHAQQYRPETYRALATQVRDHIPATATPELILDALHRWDSRDNAAPGLLPHLYDDAVRAARERRPSAARPTPGGLDERVLGWQALKTGTNGPTPLRALPGGQP